MPDMTIKKDLITKIVRVEWKMFAYMPNIEGKVSCLEDYKTLEVNFGINRSSQFMNWSQDTLESYLADLTKAEKNGRNLLAEKYARMMQSTAPSVYDTIKHLIPPLDAEIPALIDKIVQIVLEWEEMLWGKYPYIHRRGGPLHSSEDTQIVTSLETYLRGELATYSSETLRLYYENVLRQKSENVNGSEVSLYDMAKRYGYNSLEEANEKLKARG